MTTFVNEDTVIQQVAALRATAGTFLPPNDSGHAPQPLAGAILDAWEQACRIDRPSVRDSLKRQLRALVAERYAPLPEEAEKIKLAMLQDEPITVEDPLEPAKRGRRARRA
jgi:hypothetical protein